MDRKLIYIPALFFTVFSLVLFGAYQHIKSSTLQAQGPIVVSEAVTRAQLAQPKPSLPPQSTTSAPPAGSAAIPAPTAPASVSHSANNPTAALQSPAPKPEAAAARPQPSSPLPSQPKPQVEDGYTKVKRVIDELTERKKRGGARGSEKTIVLTEGDLNNYIIQRLRFEPAPGLRSLTISLGDSAQVSAMANIDLDQIRTESIALRAFKGIFGSQQQLAIDGTFTASQGTGVFQIKSARLSGKYVPSFVVNEIIRQLGSRHNPPIDVTQPFQLPLGIRSVQILRGYVKLGM